MWAAWLGLLYEGQPTFILSGNSYIDLPVTVKFFFIEQRH